MSSDKIDRHQLFSVWHETEGSLKLKSDHIAEEIMRFYSIDHLADVRSSIDEIAYEMSKQFSKLWRKYYRNKDRVFNEAECLAKPFVLPQSVLNQLSPTSAAGRGRKQLPFSKCTETVKRRKTAEIRAAHSADTLAFASSMKLREEGKKDEASLVQLATQTTPSRASRILKTWKESSEGTVVPYTPDEALALLLDLGLTKAQWNKLRSGAITRKVNLYPSYKKLLLAKKRCYPVEEAITVTETEMEIKFQALLNHTSSRIVNSKAVSLENFTDEELKNVTLFVKYGCDGTGDMSEYKQVFSDDDGTKSDASLFVTSIVPIRAITNGKILFQNPHPSSTRYCRPSHLQFAKETTALTLREKDNIDQQIAQLEPTSIQCGGRTVLIRYELLMTMVDGKVCNACTSTKSSQRCYICDATPSEMNNINAMLQRKTKVENFQFGLSTLHAHIRFFEYFLHLSYRLDFKKWSARDPDDKQKLMDRKKLIQRRFKVEMGLYVDKPRSGGNGNSNDGNTARRFFSEWELSAEITGIDPEVIYRCKTILEALASGYEINCEMFENYGIETAHKLVELYPWYYLPVSVHKVLIHGAKVIGSFLIPIGQLSEEAQESRNKDAKQYRSHHTRKFSRVATNTDLLHRLLESSDPLISCIRELPKNKIEMFSKDTLRLLARSDDNEQNSDSDSEEISNAF